MEVDGPLAVSPAFAMGRLGLGSSGLGSGMAVGAAGAPSLRPVGDVALLPGEEADLAPPGELGGRLGGTAGGRLPELAIDCGPAGLLEGLRGLVPCSDPRPLPEPAGLVAVLFLLTPHRATLAV